MEVTTGTLASGCYQRPMGALSRHTFLSDILKRIILVGALRNTIGGLRNPGCAGV